MKKNLKLIWSRVQRTLMSSWHSENIYTTKNLPDFKPVLSLSLTSLKIYRRAKKGKKEKILVFVEEYLQEVPLNC